MSPFIGITSAALVSGSILLAGLGIVPAVAGGLLAFGIQRVIMTVITVILEINRFCVFKEILENMTMCL